MTESYGVTSCSSFRGLVVGYTGVKCVGPHGGV